MSLNQSQIVRFFDQCTDDASINEVLSGYVLCKFLNGSNCAQVLQKIHYLCCYLRVSGRGHILRTGETAFKAISFEAALGGGRIGATPASTKMGIEIWNTIRRWATNKYAISTDRTYGGPGTVPAWFTPRQLAQLRRTMEFHERPAWLERYFTVRMSVLDFAAFSLPDYDSRIATLPLYASQEIVDGLESVERVLRETRIEEESRESRMEEESVQ